ncbi:lasso peptide biosynthesis B2 protein [Enterobacter sp. RD4-1-1]|uniref:lasso peptide biosynthesis B2 protein n=1 Tax=Enterobacter sp. RD4-1-1 TaxID=2986135 RepID=UPI0021E86732|nr:lasso peptide biosynthesis B2 protein [Enterobacter sp. RD4-1-1]MCV3773696.1 lasso peptide biosynthesis B2 protein [Enterobacter sp. RD4-1-1]
MLDIYKDEFSVLPGAGELLEDRYELLKRYPKMSEYLDSEYFIGSTAHNKKISFLEERWFLPEPDSSTDKHTLFQRLVMLVRILYYSKNIEKKGMLWIYNNNRRKLKSRIQPQDSETLIREAINRVSSVFHKNMFKSDCLTYSFTLKKMLNSRHVDATLVIGVRTQPFYSHAWVEVEGNIVNDDPDLRDKLSVIAEI